MSFQINPKSFTKGELRLLRELSRADIKFMIVGLSSAVFQGVAVMTEDLDLWFSSYGDERIPDAAKKAGALLITRSDPPCFFGESLEDIDIVFHCDGLKDFGMEYTKSIKAKIVGESFSVQLLPIERVLASKIAAARPKDLAAIPALKAAIAASKNSHMIAFMKRNHKT
jgi:hypothetical protein